jgi:hypothetical protein
MLWMGCWLLLGGECRQLENDKFYYGFRLSPDWGMYDFDKKVG